MTEHTRCSLIGSMSDNKRIIGLNNDGLDRFDVP